MKIGTSTLISRVKMNVASHVEPACLTINSLSFYFTWKSLINFPYNCVKKFIRSSPKNNSSISLNNFTRNFLYILTSNYFYNSTWNLSNFTTNFIKNTLRNFLRNSTINYLGNFTRNFTTNSLRNFTRNSLGIYSLNRPSSVPDRRTERQILRQIHG